MEEENKCPCCDGKGIVEGEFNDDLYPCNTCLGSGEYYFPTPPTNPTKELWK